MHNHIIHKQKVTIKTDMSADAFALQNRISDLLKNDLPGKMESLFNQISPNGEILRIDKLELNLGVIGKQNLEAEFSTKLMEQLAVAFAEKDNFPQTQRDESARFIEIDQQRSMVDTLIYFLDYGYLPWSSSIKNIKEWEEELLEIFSEKEWVNIALLVKEANKESVLRRMSLQFSNALLEKVLFALLPEIKKNWTSLHSDLYLITKTLSGDQNLWFNSLNAAAISENEQSFITAFMNRYVDQRSGKTLSASEFTLLQETIQSATVRQVLEKLNEGVKDTTVQKDIQPEEKEVSKEELFVSNSGMVILHPFLQMFFQEMGLLEEKVFKEDWAAQRAVLLLHYLATGETEVAEFNLLLEKLLCNVDFGEPVPNYIELTEKEKEESANLLKAVNRHWEPLNRTSIEGLRASFFQREGRLINKETGWLLQVEQKTIDILLDKLPWGIGTIKLPWMKNFLSVEWN